MSNCAAAAVCAVIVGVKDAGVVGSGGLLLMRAVANSSQAEPQEEKAE